MMAARRRASEFNQIFFLTLQREYCTGDSSMIFLYYAICLLNQKHKYSETYAIIYYVLCWRFLLPMEFHTVLENFDNWQGLLQFGSPQKLINLFASLDLIAQIMLLQLLLLFSGNFVSIQYIRHAFNLSLAIM